MRSSFRAALLDPRSPKILEVDETFGGGERLFDGPGLAQESDHLSQTFETDLSLLRQDVALGLEK